MLKRISLKWGKEEVNYFNKKIPVVERESWLTESLDKYYYWVILGCIISATVWVWVKIYDLHLFRVFLNSI